MPPLALWHPRYWLLWIGFGLLRLLVMLPYRWQLAIGRGLGRLLRKAMKSRDRVAARNLELCFPDATEEERSAILDEMWESVGCMVPEVGLAWWASDQRIQSLAHPRGFDRMDDLLKDGSGVLLLGAHMTCLEMAVPILCQTLRDKKGALYRKHGNPVLEYVVTRGRRCGALFPRENVRGAIRHLRRGGLLWYAPDQDYERGTSVFVPFFGIPAYTTTSSHELARMGKARVLMVHKERLPDGRGYAIEISEPLPGVPSDRPEDDSAEINRQLEAMIRRNPGQYLWLHRRFKNRPEGEKSLY